MLAPVAALLVLAVLSGCGARSELLPTTSEEHAPEAGEGGAGGPTTGPVGDICPTASTAVPIAIGSDRHVSIALDDSSVFTGTHGGQILRMAKELGAVAVTIGEGDGHVTTITPDATHVTWATTSGGVYRAAKDGGEQVTIAKGELWTMAAMDAAHIYWITSTESPNSDTLSVSEKDGSNQVILASGIDQASSIAADESGVYFSTAGESPTLFRFSVAEGALSALSGGRILRSLVLEEEFIWAIAYIDWNTGYSGRIERVEKASGLREEIAFTGSIGRFLAADQTDLYFTSGYVPSDLLKVPKSGGEPQVWAERPDDWPYSNGAFVGIAADSSAVYWTDTWHEEKAYDQREGGATFVKCKDP